ncbi:MAG: hypothetical protein JRN15_23105, partial [Nitrososphaerota archaeon]|nr:hypothetical protein [Nitrososphaerota archaeon]
MNRILKAIRHPRAALLYTVLGKERYYHLMFSETCLSASNILSPISSHLITNTDIHEHLTTLYMLPSEFNCTTIVELGTRSGESTLALAY